MNPFVVVAACAYRALVIDDVNCQAPSEPVGLIGAYSTLDNHVVDTQSSPPIA
jgi:hypothetical protein